jgi:hypothetical protein
VALVDQRSARDSELISQRVVAEDARWNRVHDQLRRPLLSVASSGIVFWRLAARFGFGEPCFTASAYRPRVAKLPLSLISPASDKRIFSTLLGLGGKPGEVPPCRRVWWHPRRAHGSPPAKPDRLLAPSCLPTPRPT